MVEVRKLILGKTKLVLAHARTIGIDCRSFTIQMREVLED